MKTTSTSPLAHLEKCQVGANTFISMYVAEHLPKNPTSRPGVEVIFGEYYLSIHIRLNPDGAFTFERVRNKPAAPSQLKREAREVLCLAPGGVEFIPESKVKGHVPYKLNLGLSSQIREAKNRQPASYWKDYKKKLRGKAEVAGIEGEGDAGRED